MTHRYRTLIAAPPGLMRRSLRAVLATFPVIELVGEADGCLSAQLMSQTLRPDIVLVAAGLPNKEVAMLLQGFREEGQYKPYTILFVNTGQEKCWARSAGADAVLLQSDPTHQLADVLNQFQSLHTALP